MNRIKFMLHSTLRLQSLLGAHRANEMRLLYLGTQLRTLMINGGGGQLSQKVATSGAAAGIKKKKTKEVSKITLIAQNQGISITTLEEAQKLAKRRDLHLIQIDELDTKTGRAVYKLVTPAEMLSLDVEDAGKTIEADKSAQKKSEKSLTIGSRIAEHDLSSRIKNITKWLAKRHEVRILIQGQADDPNCERIVKSIEQCIREPNLIGKIVQKRSKGNVVKFNIVPVEQSAQVPETQS